MPNTREDERRIDAIRFLSVDAVQRANSGHPGMPLGAAAAAYTLWTRHLRFNPKDPGWFDRDRFVLSAGHGSMLLYSLLYLTGYALTLQDIERFRQFESKTPGHPEARHTPGVEVTTGPLGQGFANAVGLAMAQAHLAATYNRAGLAIVDHYTYCLCGDGDLMEGLSAEAASLAGHLGLGKLIALYDDNKISLAAPTGVTFTESVLERFAAQRWHTVYVDADQGNGVDAIDAAIREAKNVTDRPSLVAIRTHIGYGSPEQDSFKAHGEPLGPEGVRATKAKLGWPLEPDFYVPDEVLAFYRSVGERGAGLQSRWQQTYAAWKDANAEPAAQLERILAKRLPDAVPWPTFTKENGDNIATREAGGIVMNAIAAALPELVGGSADLDPSTKTYLKNMGDFQPTHYAGRNVHYGVREHAMGAITTGLAMHEGLLPFAATFFNFSDYMKPAVRLASLTGVHAIYVFTHDSVFLGEDGPTHQPIEQLAAFRALPNCNVVRPADSLETLEAWKLAVMPGDTPWLLVLSRQKLPFLGERRADVARGAYVLADSDGTPDLVLIATGSEVSLALRAAALLEARAMKTRVVSMPCWELFAAAPQSYRDAVLPPNVKARISIEAAATFGWERWVGAEGCAYGIDRFGTSAPASAIANAFGFTPEHIASVAERHFATIAR
ncbi:MAG: transketolase [Vulcanimicrobiaceae bacterium]